MEAKVGIRHLQAKKCLGLPEAGRDRKDSPRKFGGSTALPMLCFQTWSLHAVKEYISVVLNNPVCGTSYGSPLGSIYLVMGKKYQQLLQSMDITCVDPGNHND